MSGGGDAARGEAEGSQPAASLGQAGRQYSGGMLHRQRGPRISLSAALAFALALLAPAASGQAQAVNRAPAAGLPANSPLRRTAEGVAKYVRADAAGVESLFAPPFLAQVPAPRLRALFSELHAQFGPVTRVDLVRQTSANAGVFEFQFANGDESRVRLSTNGQAEHGIIGLLIGPPSPVVASYAAVIAKMKALPGEVSFEIRRLAPGPPATLAALHANRELAIGSAFKLYVLGALTREIASGQRNWAQVVRLREHSLPSGLLQDWPLGSPFTLHTLAGLMISRSDNTAADNLLLTAGRRQVEAMQRQMGHSHPELNQPFLTTLELFQLKYGAAARRRRYLAATPAERRKLLAQLPAEPRPGLASAAGGGRPRDIEKLEWFASAADLCQAVAWFRAPERKTARAILAINPGIPQFRRQWAYVGFKGGSEPGVVSLNFLLRSHGGGWYAISMIWNNPQAAVSTLQWVGMAISVAALARKDQAGRQGDGLGRRGPRKAGGGGARGRGRPPGPKPNALRRA